MNSLDEYYGFRSKLVEALVRDIVGPASEDEILDDAPIVRYASGILYPLDSGVLDPSQDVDPGDDDDGLTADPPVALANVRYPSSMGMTFAVDTRKAVRIRLQVKAGRYVRLDEERSETAEAPATGPRRPGTAQHWQRIPVAAEPITLEVDRAECGRYLPVTEGLQLFYRVRPADAEGVAAVTAVLLNRKRASARQVRDADSFFQPEITATVPDTPGGAFTERRGIVGAVGDDEELRSYRLLYRHAREFAVGHGCSVRWEVDPGSGRCTEVATTFAPYYEVPLADTNPDILLQATGMKYLAEGPCTEIVGGLRTLCSNYEQWLDDRDREAKTLNGELRPSARAHLVLCRDAAQRMNRGCDLLEADGLVWNAFQAANTAVLRQRARTVWLRSGKPTPEPVEGDEHRWRPFQLAFILLCLEGIARLESPEREIADLLWFPTGGGKTEAYLGLIAFTVFLRRLHRPNVGGGVTALMRYTLRLLTIQQFERATLLICSCEAIRRSRGDLGEEPISIGLWVGQSATPNTLDDARQAIDKLRDGLTVTEKNPVQLRSCPWCGAPLDPRNYWIATDPRRLVISCRTEGCEFKTGLPVWLVDEDIYRRRPTLIIATADKFAALPWNDETLHLFNLGAGRHGEQAPPELIIQDELHLISGPLGTLTGLYETAVDLLCRRDGRGPKIIASTATIRRAEEQTRSLFDRSVRQFPPPALDARNSYFAVESSRDRKGTRMYVGLTAPGTSHTTLLVRAYAALLQNAADIPMPDSVKDSYMTLTGYFNSLRVLGGARMQVQDDVEDRMELLARQAGTSKRNISEGLIELTSREGADKIPEHLKNMAVSYPDPDALSVILATNMISVGVDIDRLGLMVVMGQPQSTSEYIQATSRVGRSLPGLVVVLYNAARSRDRSHYEAFRAYHAALYRAVESTSVTPFSARARDRGLHAVLVALARLLVSNLRTNGAAKEIAHVRGRVEELADRVVDRVEKIAPDEADATRVQLREIIDRWEALAEDGGKLAYNQPRDFTQALLVEATADAPAADERFPTLRSLRDVDREANLFLVQ